MEDTEITIRLPRKVVDAMLKGSGEGMTQDDPGLGLLLQHAARRALAGATDETRRMATLATLRRHLSGDLLEARSWPELQGRLMLHGYALGLHGEELGVVTRPGGHWLAALREIGPTQDILTARFGVSCPPFPTALPPVSMPPSPKHTFGARRMTGRICND